MARVFAFAALSLTACLREPGELDGDDFGESSASDGSESTESVPAAAVGSWFAVGVDETEGYLFDEDGGYEYARLIEAGCHTSFAWHTGAVEFDGASFSLHPREGTYDVDVCGATGSDQRVPEASSYSWTMPVSDQLEVGSTAGVTVYARE